MAPRYDASQVPTRRRRSRARRATTAGTVIRRLGRSLARALGALRVMRVQPKWVGREAPDDEEPRAARDLRRRGPPVELGEATYADLRDALKHPEAALRAVAIGPHAVTAWLRREIRAARSRFGSTMHDALERCPEIAWFGDTGGDARRPRREHEAARLARERAPPDASRVPSPMATRTAASPPPSRRLARRAVAARFPVIVEQSDAGAIVQLQHARAAERELGASSRDWRRCASIPPLWPSDVARLRVHGEGVDARLRPRCRAGRSRRWPCTRSRSERSARSSRALPPLAAGRRGFREDGRHRELVRRSCRWASTSAVARSLARACSRRAAPRRAFAERACHGGRDALDAQCARAPPLYRTLDRATASSSSASCWWATAKAAADPPRASTRRRSTRRPCPRRAPHLAAPRRKDAGEGAGILRASQRLIGFDGFFDSFMADEVFFAEPSDDVVH